MSIAPKNNFDETICTNLINKENKRINRQCSVGAQNNGGARVMTPWTYITCPNRVQIKKYPIQLTKTAEQAAGDHPCNMMRMLDSVGTLLKKEEVGV